ncbi:hypothetical protein GSI_08054 [Ganoderma sinense ZZ0214-1]|uniref:Glucose receptor Git3 N-terminal domain-containing protein n=1 Tax=Ganoderma sinense ZZ0214-1 TaxID=1077348 RepID=A0A2G8S7Y9_9APHY|nr:hypothetical protein GSI_08054 [Ganoderma sinense ZZ0214-1]
MSQSASLPTTVTALVYDKGQAEGLIAVVLFATISLLAITAVFLRYSWEPLVNLFKRRQLKNRHHSKAFFHTQFGAYIASLMLCNALSSIGQMVNGQWATDKMVFEGTLCNAQGILSQIGDTGGAYFAGTIAIHSFNSLVFRNKVPGWLCLGATVFGWLVAILLAAAPTWILHLPFGPVYGINGLSCGISIEHPILSVVLHLLPLMLGSVVSVIFYTLLFLILRGTLSIKNGIKLNLNRSHRWSSSSTATVEYQRFIAAIARSMLWYPFAYNILLLPEITVSLTKASGINVPFPASVFASATAALLGTANALILVNTLRILRPFLEGNLNPSTTSDASSEKKKARDADMESFFAGAKSPIGFVAPDTPKNPERAFVSKHEGKNEWTPPARTVSKPASQIGTSVARGLSRVSSHISLKRKENQLNPMIEVEVARPITPVAELNAMITVPEPTARKPTLPSSPRLGLPAPRRDKRSPLIRQPTMDVEPVEPVEPPFTTIALKTPDPLKRQASTKTSSSRHTSANESLLSMYLSRTPQQQEIEKPSPPPKPQPKPRPPPIPLSARPGPDSAVASPLPLRSARVPVKYGALSSTGAKEAFASNEWAERVRRGATGTAKTVKDERRRSRSLDLAAPTPASALRTPMYGNTLGVQTPAAHSRVGSLSAVPARTPVSAAGRRFPATGASRTGYV